MMEIDCYVLVPVHAQNELPREVEVQNLLSRENLFLLRVGVVRTQKTYRDPKLILFILMAMHVRSLVFLSTGSKFALS